MYAPATLYALPAIATDEENLGRIQARMLAISLQKLGASKTKPTPIRHGPYELGGLNLMDLRTELGISYLRFLRRAVYTGSEAGKLIILSVKYTQLEAGISYNILERPDIHVPYISSTWITSVRQFLYQHNIRVTLSEILRIRYSCKNDQCIMKPEALARYTPTQQRHINLVRLYIQALTLSDISTADGTMIREDSLNGVRAPGQRIRTHWPRQEMPTPSQRRLWKKYIVSNFIRYGRLWRIKLGPTIPAERQIMTKNKPTIVPLPESRNPDDPSTTSTTLPQFISQLPRWHRRLLSHFQQDATDVQVWRAFRSRRKITIASDGGLKHGIGTFGWKINDRTNTTLFSGSGPVDGPHDIGNSTRSELGGLTAPLMLCISLARFWGLAHRCRYKWLTDSKAAISRVSFITRHSYKPRQYPEDLDYITAIQEIHKSLGGRRLRQIKWIKEGHQDDQHDYEALSADAKLNVDTDVLASSYYWEGRGSKPTPGIPHLHEHQITIAINGIIYPSKIDEQIRFHINGSYLKGYLQTLHGWNERTWKMIDMPAFGRHFKSLTDAKKVQHMKFVYNLQPTSECKAKIQSVVNTSTPLCPCCRQCTETQVHMVHCFENPARAKAIADFTQTCKKSDANRFILVLGDLILQWLQHSNPDYIPNLESRVNPSLRFEKYPDEYVQLIHQAIQEQTAIGWMNILRGFLSNQWHTLASTYFDNNGTSIINRNDGERRVRQVIRAIYSCTHAMWLGRNDALHKTNEAMDDIRRSGIDLEISQYHKEADMLPMEDRFYCDQPLHRILRNTNIPDTSLDVIPPMLWWNIERALISSDMYIHESSDSTDY
jgi:hypothetical protein